MNDIIKQIIIGGGLTGLIAYAGNHVSPKLASVITAFPIGLIPMYFFHTKNTAKRFAYDTTFTNFVVFITYIIYDIIIRHYSPHTTLLFAAIAWTISSIILFYSGLLH